METNFAVDECPSLNKCSGAEIFLIDDEQLVVDTLTYFLRTAGFQKIQGFSDSAEAISQMRFVRPDVIFTDIRMPGINGNALVKLVRSFPHLYTVPIIAITADHSLETSRSMIRDGAESVLVKPVAREMLVQRAVQAIDSEIPLRPGPEVVFDVGSAHSQPYMSGPLVREESTMDRRRRRKNRFRGE